MTHHPRFAEQLQLDLDEQTRDAAFEEIGAHVLPALLGFLAGMMATVGLAYVWAMFL